MLEIVFMLLEHPAPEPQLPRVVDGLRHALGGAGCVLTDGVPRIRQEVVAGTPEIPLIPIDELNRRLPPHPLMMYYATTRDLVARTVDDVATSGWHRSSSYTVIRDLLGLPERRRMRQLTLPLRAPAGVARGYVVYRSGAEFTDRERSFAQRLQPALQQLDRHLHVLARHRTPPAAGTVTSARPDLTPRELTVLILLVDGLTAASIGRQLRITVSTVNTHLEHLYRKLGTNDRLSTVNAARRLGLLVPVTCDLPAV